MGRPRLVDVLEKPAEERGDKIRKITTEESRVLCKLGMSQIQHSEKARKALTVYLEHTLAQSEINNDDAGAAIDILKQAATTTHRELCDKVLTKYLSKFDGIVPKAG